MFLVALLGFFVFFVLQWAAEQPRSDGREPSEPHFVSTDRLLRNQFPQRLAGHPHARLALSAGAIGGWVLALLVPDTTLTLTLLAAAEERGAA